MIETVRGEEWSTLMFLLIHFPKPVVQGNRQVAIFFSVPFSVTCFHSCFRRCEPVICSLFNISRGPDIGGLQIVFSTDPRFTLSCLQFSYLKRFQCSLRNLLRQSLHRLRCFRILDLRSFRAHFESRLSPTFSSDVNHAKHGEICRADARTFHK